MALAYDAQPTKEQLSEEQDKARRAEKLVRVLKAEEDDSQSYAETEVAAQQMEAFRRYFGETYGDEEEGRSQVTTREVFEALESVRPELHRVMAGQNIVTVEEASPKDMKYAKQVADIMQFSFWTDNPGYELLDDFIFDGLLHRRGYMGFYWSDAEYQAPQLLTGLDIRQVQELMTDPEIEIVGQDMDQESEAGGISLVVRRLKSPAKALIETVAPEDMRLNGRSVSLDKARYVGRVLRMLRGEIARKWPDKAQEIMAYSGGEGAGGLGRRAEDVRAERFQDDDFDWESAADEASEELEVLEEYLRIDLDGDGYPELIRSYRLGDVLLEESEVEENPFASWTPLRIPHRFMGLSLHDTTTDLQRISTVLTRAGLDAVYQSVVNREAFDATKVDADGPINSTYTGTKIPVQGDPNGAILPLVGGLNTAATAWEALDVVQRRVEDRTGVPRQSKGLDSDKLTREHSGVALQQLNLRADARMELMARNLASGIADGFNKLYRLFCRHQNGPRTVKITGEWVEFDPRTWNSECRVKVHSGGMNREQSLMGLQLIGQEQDKIIEALGPANPIVTAKNRYVYQEELCRVAGYRDASAFFTEQPDQPVTDEQGQPVVDPETGEPKTQPWAPEPQPDPAMAKVQQDGQIAQATHGLKVEETKANLALQQQKDTAALQQAAEKAALDIQVTREKAAAEIQLAREKAAAEIELAWAKFEEEKALARERLAGEMEIARMQAANDREKHSEKVASDEAKHDAKLKTDVKISKNRNGGSLSE